MTMLTITDYDFPLLVGTCGIRRQLSHIRTFLYGTFAENISDKELRQYLGFSKRRYRCCGNKKYDLMEDEYPWTSRGDFPLARLSRQFFADGPTQCLFQCAAVEIGMHGMESYGLIFGNPESKTSRLQLAFIQNVVGFQRGFICRDDQDLQEFSQKQLHDLYSRAIHKSRFRRILYFLHLVKESNSWLEFNHLLLIDRLGNF